MKFCYTGTRGFIRDICRGNSGNGWTFNFALYGGTNLTKPTITLYTFYNLNSHSTNLFLNNSVDIEKVIKSNYPDIPHKIFIPGKIYIVHEIIIAIMG